MCGSKLGIRFVALVSLCGVASAQEGATPANTQIQVRSIDLSVVTPLPGLPPSPIMGYPLHCSADGDIYVEVYGDPRGPGVKVFPDLYRISSQREVKRIQRPTPDGFAQFITGSFFASEHTLVSLIQASKPKDPSAQQSAPQKNFFLSVTDKDGNHPDLIKLELKFDPIKVAVFESGEFIALGADPNNDRPVIALLHRDGSFDRNLDMDRNLETLSQGSNGAGLENAGQSDASRRGLLSSLVRSQFAPWGSEVLLVQPGSNWPIYRIREFGKEAEVRPVLPEGFQLEGVLGSGGRDTWVIRLQSTASSKRMAESGITENPEERLFEVNPRNGEVLKELAVTGPAPGEVACAADGRLSTIYFGAPGKPGVPDQLTFAAAFR